MEHSAKLFKALSEPTRLRIVNLLARRRLCVSDLQQLLAASQPYVSRHLAFLRRAGLVRRVRLEGRELYGLNLSMATHPFISLVNELRAWTPQLQADRKKLAQLEILGTLRADRSKPQSEESSGASDVGEHEEPSAFASRVASSAA
jgi:ArsR family transcriptional regulator